MVTLHPGLFTEAQDLSSVRDSFCVQKASPPMPPLNVPQKILQETQSFGGLFPSESYFLVTSSTRMDGLMTLTDVTIRSACSGLHSPQPDLPGDEAIGPWDRSGYWFQPLPLDEGMGKKGKED